jgi:hypothetical protein
MSISWGKVNRFKFMPGGNLSTWTPPAQPAVYAITYKQNPVSKPNSHTVLYFGKGDDLYQQAPEANREVINLWANNGGDINDLFIFVHPMPNSSAHERRNVQEQLISEYSPDCNRY